MKLLNIILLTSIALLITACSNSLSNRQAEQLLKDKITQEQRAPMFTNWITVLGTVNEVPSILNPAQVKILHDKGYIDKGGFSEKIKDIITYSNPKTIDTTTDKLLKAVTPEVTHLQLATIDQIVITDKQRVPNSTAEDKKVRHTHIKYTVEYVPNALGKELGIEKTLSMKEQGEASFTSQTGKGEDWKIDDFQSEQ